MAGEVRKSRTIRRQSSPARMPQAPRRIGATAANAAAFAGNAAGTNTDLRPVRSRASASDTIRVIRS